MTMTKYFLLTATTIVVLFSSCKKWGDCDNYSNDNAQTIEHDGLTREYIIYVPSTYDANARLPVVFNLHGYGGLASEYMTEADMRPQAESDTFLLIYPQGACLEGFSHWNTSLPGGDNKSDVDDLGFIGALIDQLTSDYNIDEERIYACGYSNGGMMSYALACYQSERIAAIGSVSGSMIDQSSTCVPSHPMPLIKLHGTSDDVLPYNGGSDYTSAQSTVDYWVNFNSANTTAAVQTDGNIEHYVYANGDSSVSVEHYKYIEGGHVWFNTAYQGANASQLVWDFFSEYDINGLRD
jgi:polyhydroxybutyrate depolymerase